MNSSDKKIAHEAKESVTAFFNQFGDLDEYKLVVLEVLLEQLYGRKKTIPLPSPPGQDGDQAAGDVSGGQPGDEGFHRQIP